LLDQFGRTKIYSDVSAVTADNVKQVLSDTLVYHITNSAQCDRLYRYYKGDQPILNRQKEIRPEINNKIVENRANEIVSFKTGYLCGEPLQYVSRSSAEKASGDIGRLNDMMLLCGKDALDKQLAEWMYICGAGYRMITPNSQYIRSEIVPKLLNRQTDFSEDEAPFQIFTLDPRYTYVVYHSSLAEEPLMAVKYVVRVDKSIVYSVYTPTQYFELDTDNPAGEMRVTRTENRSFNSIPIVEYPLNNSRLGIFEIVQPILDAINTVQSNRLDGIEQFIQSLLVLYNCDIDDDTAKALREAGLIKLKSVGDNKADLKEIAAQLDQQQTQTLVDYMYQTVLNIVGMPNRNGGSSTSDTGSAVVMRDGWSAAEARAKSDELMFKQSERQFLKVALQIIRATVGTSLTLADVEAKFTRRNYENIANKSQVLTTMLGNPHIHPLLAFEHCGMFSDPEAAYAMSEEYFKAQQPVTVDPNAGNGGGTGGGDPPV